MGLMLLFDEKFFFSFFLLPISLALVHRAFSVYDFCLRPVGLETSSRIYILESQTTAVKWSRFKW